MTSIPLLCTVRILLLVCSICRLPATLDKSSGDSNSLILLNISPSSFPGSLNLIWLTPTILLLFNSRTEDPPVFLNSIFPVGIKISEAVILPLALILPITTKEPVIPESPSLCPVVLNVSKPDANPALEV